MKPLEGLKVIELGMYVSTPGVTRLFADWGAEVIKVESLEGDAARRLGGSYLRLPMDPDCCPTFTLPNSGKKMISLDLKSPEGMAVMEKLLAQADIFVSNTRYGGLTRLGLDYESLHTRYPRLICGYINGYGFEGPEKNNPGFDMTCFWARSGILNALREPENAPKFPPAGIGDTATSAMLAAGVLAAVIKRYQTGEGTKVTTSLLGTGIWCNYSHVAAGQERSFHEGEEPFLTPYPYKEWRNPFYHIYKCKDGRMFFLLGGGFKKITMSLNAMGFPELATDPRFVDHKTMTGYSDYLYDRFTERFLQEDSQYWAKLFTDLDAPFEILTSNAEVSQDPQAWANNYLTRTEFPDGSSYILPNTPVDFSDMEKVHTRHVGALGCDTREILTLLGYTPEEIQNLLDKGVALEPQA